MNKTLIRLSVLGCVLGVMTVAHAEEDAQGSLRDQIVEHIAKAKSTINVVIYEIGSEEIADALADAKDRGVRVRVILDEERSFGVTAPEKILLDKGIPMRKV